MHGIFIINLFKVRLEMKDMRKKIRGIGVQLVIFFIIAIAILTIILSVDVTITTDLPENTQSAC